MAIPAAGSVQKPPLDVAPADIRDHAYSIIRVLNRAGEAVGPWAEALDGELLLTGLRDIYTPEVAADHTARGDRLRTDLNVALARHGLPGQVTGAGSILCFHFHDRPIHSPADTAGTRPQVHALFHLEMLARGIYFARRGYMSLSLELTREDDAALLAAFDEVLSEFGELLYS